MRITAKYAAIERIIDGLTRAARDKGQEPINEAELREQLQKMTLKKIYEAEAAYNRRIHPVSRQEEYERARPLTTENWPTKTAESVALTVDEESK